MKDLTAQITITLGFGDDAHVLPSTFAEGILRAQTRDGSAWVEFAVSAKHTYTTLIIRDWQGIAGRTDASLRIRLPAGGNVYLTELDYMGTYRATDEARSVEWKSPLRHFGVNPGGGMAIFTADSDAQHDEILLSIWVDEGQPHPRVVEDWNLATARNWLGAWQKKFASRSQMVVNAGSLQELYDLVPYAEKADIDEIYIFTNTWRPDPFWPVGDVNWALNRKVFPNGRADLRPYSDYLGARGMRLNLHYVSGGFGQEDPVYVGSAPHPDLAGWGTGRLAAAVDADHSTIRVAGATGLDAPAFKRGHFSALLVQIGNEIVAPAEHVLDDDGNLLLTRCARGKFLTRAASHAKGETVKFLVTPYGINFVPDNDSELLYEVADNFASLLNDCNIAHAEFDGAEIHGYNGNYGYVKFAQRIYERTDHAITSHDSSGSAARCFFEYRFKSTQKLFRGTCPFTHGNWLVPMQVDSPSRPASTLLDAQFFLSQGHYGGAMGISKPEPMFGVTTEMLATHGLTGAFFELLRHWKEAARRLTDEQHELIERSLGAAGWPMPEASHHRVADTVYAVAADAAGELALVPTQVMCRDQGDITWTLGQEFGTIAPRQFIQTGQTLVLNNRFGPQAPGFLIRVMPAFDPAAAAIVVDEAVAASGGAFEDKDFFVEGNASAAASGRAAPTENINVRPDREPVVLEARNDRSDDLYNVRNLFEWEFRGDLSGHPGLAVEMDGDGSGALVVVQLAGKGCRDFVFPVDFTGRRTVVVPGGEVSWYRADWGFRMGTKCMDYSQVKTCRLGLGMTPAKSSVSVKVHKVVALRARPAALENPVVQFNDQTLMVSGTIAAGHYLHYAGGDAVAVYDLNWHKIKDLPVASRGLVVANGRTRIAVMNSGQTKPWLECQFMVKGEPMMI